MSSRRPPSRRRPAARAATERLLDLLIEKPAAGGAMIARSEGQVVLVSGTLPGERVRARVARTGRGVLFAETVDVLEAAPERRDPFVDLACGGCLYAHIEYPRQLTLKAEVIADAFARLAHLPLEGPVRVAASPEHGYRMRARLHWRGGRLGWFREGSHDLCDARSTRQLLPETADALDALAAALSRLPVDLLREVELSENVDASERAVHLDAAGHLRAEPLAALGELSGITGVSSGAGGADVIAGTPYVHDTVRLGATAVALRRHAAAFFQGNRNLLAPLVDHVTNLIPLRSRVMDLYAGVGLFSISAAMARASEVTAVEGDATAAADLAHNAVQTGGQLVAVHQPVEEFLAQTSTRPDLLLVDPPRTGMSKEALDGALRRSAASIVYVSCDVATLARDARRIVDAGYRLREVAAFDLFPNTPHVETVVRFAR